MKIIAVDIGTSRVKAARFDQTGAMRQLVDRRMDRTVSPETQDAAEWGESAEALIRLLTADHPADAVALTGNMHSLLGIDSGGVPVARAELWSDNSAVAEARELARRYGKKTLAATGNPALPLFPAAKMLRMARQRPECYRQCAFFLQSKDYIGYRLTGEAVTDPSDASGALLMDLERREWASDWIAELGLSPEKMPEIRPSCALRGKVTPEAAKRTGLAAGTPVFTGCGDLASAALGSGCDEHTFALTLGTSGQLLAAGRPGDREKLAGKLFVFAHAVPGRDLYLGSVPAGGFNFEWLARCHGVDLAQFFRLAHSCPTREDLPLYLPYLMGRGAPYMSYEPEGGWLGLSADHTREDMFRAAILGTLAALRESADLFEQLSGPRDGIVLQALASREPAVRECAGELFRQGKLLPLNAEASLQGAALIALTGLQVFSSLEEAMAKTVKTAPLDFPASPAAQRWFRRFQTAVHAPGRGGLSAQPEN